MTTQIIDGGVLEGGGQILRIALAVSTIKKIPIRICNIRVGRSKPGLMPQHLKGLLLLKEISKATVRGDEIGSTEVEFIPNFLQKGRYCADTQTAGSIALLIQVALPCCYFSDGTITLNLRGGTNAEMAPQIDYITEVFRPNLEKFGASFDFDLIRRGYFPKGGGEVYVTIQPTQSLRSVELVDQGYVTKIYGWSFVAGTLPIKVAYIMADAAVNALKSKVKNVNITIERYKETPEVATGNCSGIIIVCETSTGCILGGSALGKREKTNEEVGIAAAEEIISALSCGACVDVHCQDQIVLFMALANGNSKVRVGEVTLHTKTAIYVLEQLTKAKFTIHNEGPDSNIIECEGIGQENV